MGQILRIGKVRQVIRPVLLCLITSKKQELEMTNNERRKKIITQLLGQEDKLPTSIKELVNITHPDRRIELYALSDLSDDFQLVSRWILLCEDQIIVARTDNNEAIIDLSFRVAQVKRIKELKSASCSALFFLDDKDNSLLQMRFTSRQKIVMGHLQYLVEEKIKNADFNTDSLIDADEEYLKAVLHPVEEAQKSVSSDDKKAIWRLLSYLAPYKKDMILGTIGAVLMTVVSMVPAYISGQMIDSVIQPFQNGELNFSQASQLGWVLVAAIAATRILREFFVWIRLKKMSILGENIAMDLREELYSHLQTLGLDFFSKKQTGSIISRVSSDTDRIWDFVAFGIVEVGISIVTLLALSIVLISLDWKLGLIMTLPVPLLLWSIYLHGEKMKKIFLKAWRKWSDLTSVLSDTIPGMQVVKAFNQEEREVKRFSKSNNDVTNEFKDVHNSWTKFWPCLMMGIHTTTIAVWFFATPRLISTQGQAEHITAGTFISFLLYMGMFAAPIEIIGQMSRMMNRALSSAYRIFEILDTNPTIVDKEDAIKMKSLSGRVEFRDVKFSYDGVRQILKGMDFTVEPGEMIGLVGASGGGKSTITKLIARFYDANSGEILIDGIQLKDLETGPYRKQVGMVLQDPYLFHGSILENIRYGMPETSLKKVIEAAKVANAHDFIGRLTHGYDTIIGERGHTLSGGERQRISIARAILHDPKILILDEATSAVDTETERNIQEALDRLIEGRTVFAVAHRLSTLRKANRIFVIENGDIVEQGSHEKLLSDKKGAYRKLHNMQHEMNEFFAL